MKAPGALPDMASDKLIENFISSQVTARGLDVRTEKAYRMDLRLFYQWMVGLEEKAQRDQQPEAGRSDERSLVENISTECSFSEGFDESAKLAKQNAGESLRQKETACTWKAKIDAYLCFLDKEKKLRASTISRKYKVFQYYVSYLKEQGILAEGWKNQAGELRENAGVEDRKESAEESSKGSLEGTSRETARGEASVLREKAGVREATLSKQEVDALFQSMNHEYETLDSDFRRRVCLRDQVMLKLLFYHGIEISELLALEITDYNKDQGILMIRGKRGKSRTVHIFSADLRHQMAGWLDEQEYFQREEAFTNRMFLSKLGKPLSMKMVILIFDKYRVLAGIEKECTPKSLKTSMQRYGQELVMEWCG